MLGLVMDWAEGGDLRERIKQSPLAEYEIWRILRQIAEGLQFLHSKNIIHMDIKPQNILFQNGQVKLADFGISTRSIG